MGGILKSTQASNQDKTTINELRSSKFIYKFNNQKLCWNI
jgi:hypothetical protein